MKVKIGDTIYYMAIGNWYSFAANILVIGLCIYGIYWLVQKAQKNRSL